MQRLKPGDKAPEFSLADQNGTRVNLFDFKGRLVLLYFYPKADTPGCTKQSCSIRDAAVDFAAQGIYALGLSPDQPQALLEFDRKYGLGFVLLSDPNHATAEAYAVWGEKSRNGKTSIGIIRSSFLIDQAGKISQTWYDIKPEDTVPFALDAAKRI